MTDETPIPDSESSTSGTPAEIDIEFASIESPPPNMRLYVPDNEEWNVHIKRDSERVFCYAKNPDEDWFHLILSGEIYVARQHEKYCLNCALRMNFLTQDRLFWQHRVPKKQTPVL